MSASGITFAANSLRAIRAQQSVSDYVRGETAIRGLLANLAVGAVEVNIFNDVIAAQSNNSSGWRDSGSILRVSLFGGTDQLFLRRDPADGRIKCYNNSISGVLGGAQNWWTVLPEAEEMDFRFAGGMLATRVELKSGDEIWVFTRVN